MAGSEKNIAIIEPQQALPTLKHGFARGGEAVILTESVRTYYKILLKYELPYSWGFWLDDERGHADLRAHCNNTGFHIAHVQQALDPAQ